MKRIHVQEPRALPFLRPSVTSASVVSARHAGYWKGGRWTALKPEVRGMGILESCSRIFVCACRLVFLFQSVYVCFVFVFVCLLLCVAMCRGRTVVFVVFGLLFMFGV